jgi:uncharacterized YigZ family protein
MADHFQTIIRESSAEFKDRGSVFIAYAYPIQTLEEFKLKLSLLKKEHPKAAHHCFAYRLGVDKNVYRVTDDGEPSGSAGRPILGQIDSKEITNVLVVVVRYFGGTLLGVPGLINAYKTVSRNALELAGLVEKPVLVHFKLEFDYTKMNEVMRIVKAADCVIIHQELQLFCNLRIGIPIRQLNAGLARFEDIQGLTIAKI